MSLPLAKRNLLQTLPRIANTTRPFSVLTRVMAEGDTGATRAGGVASSDGWTRRAKASEDMYIKEQENIILQALREKIATQEAALEKDRAVLGGMVKESEVKPKLAEKVV